MIISFLSQKGGVGKSTLARGCAVECAQDARVVLADMDISQESSCRWARRRSAAHLSPGIFTQVCGAPHDALALAPSFDILIIDGAPGASVSTMTIAKHSDWIIIPTGTGIDDLEPSLELADEFMSEGIGIERILLVVFKVAKGGDRDAMEAKKTILDWGHNCTNAWLPYRTGYSLAMDAGKSIGETSFNKLNDHSGRIYTQINDYFTKGETTHE